MLRIFLTVVSEVKLLLGLNFRTKPLTELIVVDPRIFLFEFYLHHALEVSNVKYFTIRCMRAHIFCKILGRYPALHITIQLEKGYSDIVEITH